MHQATKPRVLKTPYSRFSAKSLAAISAVLAAAVPVSSYGLGIRIPDQDAFAIARGNAFVATADNPSAIYYNPAGISQLHGVNFQIGGYGILINDHFEGGGTSVNTRQKLQGVPQFYATAEIPKVPLTVGLGFYAPYGLGLEWPDNAPFLVSPNFPKKGELQYLTINPVVAYKPIKSLSLSVGPTFNHAESELQFIPFGSPANNFRFRGRDNDLGFTAGVLWKPLKKHSFGISYRSETTMNLQGHADTDVVPALYPAPFTKDATTRFAFPQNIAFGYSYRPNRKWNLELDADWTDWSRLNDLTLHQSGPNGGDNKKVPLNWDASWRIGLGATRYFRHGWHVSGGYAFSQNSVPSEDFNPIVPDSDRHVFSVGVGRKYKHISWDIAYQLAYGPERTIDNGGGGANVTANGNYTYLSHALALTVGYRF